MNERDLFEVLIDSFGGREQIRFKCLGPNLVVRGHVVNSDEKSELYETNISPTLVLASDLMPTYLNPTTNSAMFWTARKIGNCEVSPVNFPDYEEITE